ncbi:hypothetical protein CWRG_01601 [Chthonomonas calidirosea]|uniref:anti-sigma factor family protein n=1 Tax=Chthonomonas calidirosea TaxID=454171 RepID=UPI0006DD55C6|nr:hypothetical protein [Chthonomonas calidirosea]CEK16764.1 hypothetical protein CWRG_01601 [Chthonomonas calidirosea]
MPKSTEFEPNGNQQFEPFNEERIWNLLSSYIDGELTQEEQEVLHGLLAKSPQWKKELARLEATTQILRKESEVEPPAHLRDAILAATVKRRTWRQQITELWMRKRIAGSVVLSGGALAIAVALWVAFVRFSALPASHSPSWRSARVAVLPQTPTLQRRNRSLVPSSHHPLQNRTTTATSSRSAETLIAKLVAPLRSNPLAPNFAQQQSHSTVASLPSENHSKVAQTTQPVRRQTSLQTNRSSRSIEEPTKATPSNASDTMVQMAAVFSPVPGMDQINQPAFSHRVGDMAGMDTASPHAGSSPSSQTQTTGQKPSGATTTANSSATTSPSATTVQPVADKQPVTNQGDTPLAYMAYLPPDALKFRSTASIKRELSERNLGLSRIAIENTEQRQARIVLVSGRF